MFNACTGLANAEIVGHLLRSRQAENSTLKKLDSTLSHFLPVHPYLTFTDYLSMASLAGVLHLASCSEANISVQCCTLQRSSRDSVVSAYLHVSLNWGSSWFPPANATCRAGSETRWKWASNWPSAWSEFKCRYWANISGWQRSKSTSYKGSKWQDMTKMYLVI